MACKTCNCSLSARLVWGFAPSKAVRYKGIKANELTPLGIDLDSVSDIRNGVIAAKDDKKFETIKFRLIAKCVEEVKSVEIFADGKLMKSFEKKDIRAEDGDYFFEWDGYGDLTAFKGEETALTIVGNPDSAFGVDDDYQSNTLNTSFLKRHEMEIKAILIEETTKKESILLYTLSAKPLERGGAWLDSVINKDAAGENIISFANGEHIRLKMRPSLQDGSDSGGKRSARISGRDFEGLFKLACIGMAVHWSRNGNTRKCISWGEQDNLMTAGIDPIDYYWDMFHKTPTLPDDALLMTTNTYGKLRSLALVKAAKDGVQPTVEKYSSKKFDLKYSHNPSQGIFDRATSLKFFEQVVYLATFWSNSSPSSSRVMFYIDTDFMETSAHEIGHEVMNDSYSLLNYSWIHKDSSTICQGVSKKRAPYYTKYPLTTELDLMKYPTIPPGANKDTFPAYRQIYEEWPSHIVAADEEVRGVLYLTSLKFSLTAKKK